MAEGEVGPSKTISKSVFFLLDNEDNCAQSS